VTLTFNKHSCNIWQVLTKPSSVELPAVVLGFGVGGFGNFYVVCRYGGIKQPTYLWQALDGIV